MVSRRRRKKAKKQTFLKAYRCAEQECEQKRNRDAFYQVSASFWMKSKEEKWEERRRMRRMVKEKKIKKEGHAGREPRWGRGGWSRSRNWSERGERTEEGGWETENPWLLAGTPESPFTPQEREPCSKVPLHIFSYTLVSCKGFLSGGKSLQSSMNTKSLRRTLH